jgi:ubiquinone/menaquinone biosynthesis C-methylase UbiE
LKKAVKAVLSSRTISNIFGSPRCKKRFLEIINRNGKLLDVGCGYYSAYDTKMICSKIFYTGIDIVDYNQKMPNMADEYIVTTPEKFADTIINLNKKYDTVISSHNLEHCNDREKTLEAMIKVLKPNGYLFLSFPSELSIYFPSRKGTLNYYDDSTHKGKPPDFTGIIQILNKNNMKIIFSCKSYKPFFTHKIGFLFEWKSKQDREVKRWTWAYWGFEAIIWAKKYQ